MLTKAFRIGREEFASVKKSSKRREFKHFHVYFTQNTKEHSRYSIVVSKKVCPKAVDRNALRRKLYAYLRTSMDTYTLSTNIDALFYCKRSAATASYADLSSDVDAFFTSLTTN